MEEIYYHIIKKSSNRKTGPIAVLTSSHNTCSDVCPFKSTNSCYAMGGPLRLHWDKVSSGARSLKFEELLSKLELLADEVQRPSRIRLWQAGDMPGLNGRINAGQVRKLIEVLQKFDQPFGYTHKPLDREDNKAIIKLCNDNGVAINLSGNNLAHVDSLCDLDIGPVSVTLPSDAGKHNVTPAGRKVLVCPAVLTDGKVTCATCGGNKGALCWRIGREYVVGFPAHGMGVRKASEVARGNKA